MPDTALVALPGADDGLGGPAGPGALSEETASISAADIQVGCERVGWVGGSARMKRREPAWPRRKACAAFWRRIGRRLASVHRLGRAGN
jgi:hypothetical protein